MINWYTASMTQDGMKAKNQNSRSNYPRIEIIMESIRIHVNHLHLSTLGLAAT